MTITRKFSPNFNDRNGFREPRFIILHYTEASSRETDEIFMTPDRLSAHYVIDEGGDVFQYVDETKRAWHAGVSAWENIRDINSASIGIELVNGGHASGLPPFPKSQIQSLIHLIDDIRGRYHILDQYILGHSDIAPGRKIDPGEAFPWEDLNQSDIGLMPDIRNINSEDIKLLQSDPARLHKAFIDFGYDENVALEVLIPEFRRHFLRHDFDKGSHLDQELCAALLSLLQQKI